MAEIQHLSYSSISAYQLCPRSWRYRYVDKVPVAPSLSLVLGSVVHEVIERELAYLQDSKDLYGKVGVAQGHELRFLNVWKERSTELAPDDQNKGLQDGIAVFRSPALFELIKQTNCKRDSDGTPYIERRIELKVPGVPVPVIGFIDVIHEDGIPGDFKTAARMWSEDKPAGETQPLVYLAALSQIGEMVAPRFRHHVITKGRSVDVRTFETEYSVASLFWVFESIREVWKGIQANVFPPNPSSWKCSEKWCEYWTTCRGKR